MSQKDVQVRFLSSPFRLLPCEMNACGKSLFVVPGKDLQETPATIKSTNLSLSATNSPRPDWSGISKRKIETDRKPLEDIPQDKTNHQRPEENVPIGTPI